MSDIILPTTSYKDCLLKEVSTIRNVPEPANGRLIKNSNTNIIFGRTLGIAKGPQLDTTPSFGLNQDQTGLSDRTKPIIRLVRLMFYLPNVLNETDVWFFLDEVGISNNF